MNKSLLKNLGFHRQVRNVEEGVCAICEGKIGEFKDEQSKKEFRISGMCQKCQDRIFGGSDDCDINNNNNR